MTGEVVFEIGQESADAILDRVRAEYDGRPQPSEEDRATFVDTFDWRVFFSGNTLELRAPSGIERQLAWRGVGGS